LILDVGDIQQNLCRHPNGKISSIGVLRRIPACAHSRQVKYIFQISFAGWKLVRRTLSEEYQRNDPLARKFTRLKVWGKYIVAGLQPADTSALVLKRSVAPSFDIKGFQPFL